MSDAQVTESLTDKNCLVYGESLADGKSGDSANGMEDTIKDAGSSETTGNVVNERSGAEQRNSMDAPAAQAQTLGLYDVPSRRLSLLVEGRDYLKYRETFERLLFSEKMTPAQKDARILKLAMTCLTEKMDAISVATGEPFVRAEMLAG